MQKAEKPATRVPVWLRVALGISLGLNLLVVGVVGGAMLRYGGPDGMRPPPRSIGAALFRALPGEDRRAIRDRSTGEAMAKGMSGGHHARQMAQARAVSAVLRATPFDREALSQILESQAGQRRDMQSSMQQAWLERVAGMSAADRQAYADRLEHSIGRARDKDRRKKSRSD